VAAGGSLGVASVAAVAATASDALSGPAGDVTPAVDGRALSPAEKLDGAVLGLGAHQLTASAVDVAGNKSVTTVPFTVVTSYPEAVKLVDRYQAAGTVPLATATVMKVQLGLAERAVRRNQQVVAAVALDLFLAKARTVRDVPARTLLIAVGQDLKAGLA